jgi:acyl carrier protein/NAD(P)-dependent dehydrogenase (short-subunit alcohol dehydrogenase family)
MVGALGEMGELICSELGRRFQSRLIIFSRRSAEAAREALARVEAAGASLLYRSVDVLDVAALKREMRALKERGEVIHGVIHAARRVLDAPIARKSFREFSSVMAAKVEGTLNVEALTADEPLEFFIAFSSVASLGIKGSPDYAYSTAFQNALARKRSVPGAQRERSVRFRALCWGQFERDGGVHPDRLPARIAELTDLGITAIDAPASIAAMESGLCQGSSVIGFVAVHDKAKFRQAIGFDRDSGHKTRRILDEIDAFERRESGESRFAEFLTTLQPEDYTETVRERVIEALKRSERECSLKDQRDSTGESGRDPLPMRISEHLAKVLKLSEDTLDHAKPFQEYGLDSISAMQFSSRLEKEFKIAIQPRWLIEYPSIASFCGKLTRELHFEEKL